MKNVGIIYASVGESYVNECLRSACSILRFHPSIYIEIWCDKVPSQSHRSINYRRLPECHYAEARSIAIVESSIKYGLYLDSDTVVKGDLTEIFQLLENYNLVLACNPMGPNIYKNPLHFNSGVIGFSKDSGGRLIKFLTRWREAIKEHPVEEQAIGKLGNDQEMLNQVIFKERFCEDNDLSLKVVDNCIYNARGIMFKKMKREHIYHKAKILHCHSVFAPWYKKIWWKILNFRKLLRFV